VLKDGLPASRLLDQPVDDTLYFAGEAWGEHAARGTVAGALASGRAAAHALLDRLAADSA
jgi:monoamine oxidase